MPISEHNNSAKKDLAMAIYLERLKVIFNEPIHKSVPVGKGAMEIASKDAWDAADAFFRAEEGRRSY